ncbi:MAG: hypothetical protein JXA78_07685 [Anaerolineales bacterium]|nr:hypothetical protein [Anaerolineales bacterium]
MVLIEPPRSWQDELHERILQRDVTAFAELCEYALPFLVEFLRTRFPEQDTPLCETAAIDCLLNYQAKAPQYDPGKISLFAFLRMAARRDTLNAIDKDRRRERRLTDISTASDLQASEQGLMQEQAALDEWLQERTDLSLAEILKVLNEELDDSEKGVLLLMLDGVRESKRYSALMGIEHMDEVTQQQAVKRAKDRLVKKLRRFGERIKTA